MAARKSSRVNPTYKTKYRVRNWKEYERGLRSRGDVTIWLSEAAIAAWTQPKSGLRGGRRRYSNLAILTALTLRLVFRLPLRRQWHKESGYRQQARVENGFFRYKSLLGGTLRARNSNAQTREAVIGCHVLNRMAALGRPESYAVVS